MRTKKLVTNNWETPQAFFDKYNSVYHFDVDAAASPENAKCAKYITEEQDALTIDWAHYGTIPHGKPNTVWVNPPYTQILKWVKKAYEESLKGATVVMLLPAGTDTSWFHDYVVPFGKVEFVRGRLNFKGGKTAAMSPSIVVVFNAPKSDSHKLANHCLE